jgi:acyl-CoA reductase-like NAD-dependent aldehyde dehydrogenase
MAKGTGRLPVSKTYKLFIGGKFPRTESGRYYQAANTNGDFVANYCRASRKDFRNSMVAARGALTSWASRNAFNRGQILYRMAEMLESRGASMREGLVNLAGYSAKDAQTELDASVDRLVWYAGWSDKFAQVYGSINPVATSHFNFTTPEPVGVVTCFVSKNSPLLGIISAMAPVIVSGNTLILIVENDAPTIAMELAEVLATSDLPGGVVNILTGTREELSSHVAGHMDVDAVASFGADVDERRQIQVLASESVKRVKFFDDPAREKWTDDENQSPYWILPFVEFKTAWHPIGV